MRWPVSASLRVGGRPGAGSGVQSVRKPFRVGHLSTGSYGQCHSSFFLGKRRNQIIFIPFWIVSINFSGKIHPTAVSFWTQFLWELKLVGHPKPVTGDTTLFIQKPGEVWPPLLLLKSHHAAHVSGRHIPVRSGRLGEVVQEYFGGTCRQAENSRPPKAPTPLTLSLNTTTSLPRAQLLVFKLLIEKKNKYEYQSRKLEF